MRLGDRNGLLCSQRPENCRFVSLPGKFQFLTKPQIRSLPDLAVVLQSNGLTSSEPSFTDDFADGIPLNDVDEADPVKQMLFHPIGSRTPRPHLLVGSLLDYSML